MPSAPIAKIILQRRPGEQDPAATRDLVESKAHPGALILDLVRLVQDDDPP